MVQEGDFVVYGLMGVIAAACILVTAWKMLMSNRVMIELHGYQIDFLNAFKGMDASAALQSLCDRGMADKKVYKAMFDDFHCIHCGSVSPAPWIANRKGDKKPYPLKLSKEAKTWLEQPVLVKVEKQGEPPKKVIVKGAARRADLSKATRCAVDWAIKTYGAVADGKPMPE